jgi:hypothetical protein
MAVSDIADNENELRVINEFLDELRDTAARLQVLLGNLRSKSVPMDEGLATLKRDASNMQGQSQGMNLPMIKLVTHRLNEYVGDLKALSDTEIDEIQVFVDKIDKLANGEAVSEDDAPKIIRALPAKRSADIDFGKIEKKNIEILLVLPEKSMSRIVERELAACGYRTSVIRDAFSAIETVVRTKPDMVLASMELGSISGIDLGCALAAITTTQQIPFALFTSYEWGNPKLRGMPPRAALIRKGPQFGDDLAETLARFEIT